MNAAFDLVHPTFSENSYAFELFIIIESVDSISRHTHNYNTLQKLN